VREGEVAAGDRFAVAAPGQRNDGHPWQARRGTPSLIMNGRVALAHGDEHPSSQVARASVTSGASVVAQTGRRTRLLAIPLQQVVPHRLHARAGQRPGVGDRLLAPCP
jgi:hypothetical protein